MSRKYAPRMAAAERREQLLDAALHVFVVDGAGAFNIGSVAREAGVTRPVVYDFFANAGELTRELLKREEARALEQIAAAQAGIDLDDDLETVIAGTTTAFLAAVADSPMTWRAILMPPTGTAPIVKRHISQGRGRIVAQIEELINQAIDEDRIPQIDVPIAARTLVMLAEGAARLVLTDAKEFPPERIARFISGVISSIPQPAPH